MNLSILEVERLSVEYDLVGGGHRAVDDVTFSLDRGSILGILGESGSGKSTLVLSILDLLDSPGRIVSGSIKYEGMPTPRGNEELWRKIRGKKIGLISQSSKNSFNPSLTLGFQMEEALTTHFPMTRDHARQKILEALDRVRMPRAKDIMNNYTFELSGGMCQRAALALALVLEPKLLIADEPTSSLDVINQVEITNLLEEIHREMNLSMLIISHDIGFISRLAGRIAVMHRGSMVDYGDTASVLYYSQNLYTKTLLNSISKLTRERTEAKISKRVISS